MDEKTTENEKDQPIEKTKVYTPPSVTKYGKLTDLTAAGSGGVPEQGSNSTNKLRP